MCKPTDETIVETEWGPVRIVTTHADGKGTIQVHFPVGMPESEVAARVGVLRAEAAKNPNVRKIG